MSESEYNGKYEYIRDIDDYEEDFLYENKTVKEEPVPTSNSLGLANMLKEITKFQALNKEVIYLLDIHIGYITKELSRRTKGESNKIRENSPQNNNQRLSRHGSRFNEKDDESRNKFLL